MNAIGNIQLQTAQLFRSIGSHQCSEGYVDRFQDHEYSLSEIFRVKILGI